MTTRNRKPPPTLKASLMNRSTGELVIIAMAGTVLVLLLGAAITVAIVEIQDPDVDTSAVVVLLSDTMNTLIGVIAGFLAGRSEHQPQQL